MSEDDSFLDLLNRTRTGDDAAAATLVERYEPQIRRVIRIRLTDPLLRQTMDSMDICQSILGDFFLRAATGQFDLQSPEQLIKLLSTMARNKLTNHANAQQAAKRDMRRRASADVGEMNLAHDQESPSMIVSRRELLERARYALSTEEQMVAELRVDNTPWDEIADQYGGTAESQRKKYARAMDRVATELGLDQSFA